MGSMHYYYTNILMTQKILIFFCVCEIFTCGVSDGKCTCRHSGRPEKNIEIPTLSLFTLFPQDRVSNRIWRWTGTQHVLMMLLSPPPTVPGLHLCTAMTRFSCEREGFEFGSSCFCSKYPYSLISLSKSH